MRGGFDRIDGIEATTALKVISEVAPSLLRFPSVKHFTSWLGLCPGTKISGGKKLSGKSRAGANRAALGVTGSNSHIKQKQVSTWSPTTVAYAPD